jgi:hypothetical protein
MPYAPVDFEMVRNHEVSRSTDGHDAMVREGEPDQQAASVSAELISLTLSRGPDDGARVVAQDRVGTPWGRHTSWQGNPCEQPPQFDLTFKPIRATLTLDRSEPDRPVLHFPESCRPSSTCVVNRERHRVSRSRT